jgi:hypothetical protein
MTLVVVAAVGLMFASTRQLGLLSVGLLCLIAPVLVVLLALIGLGLYLCFKLYRRKNHDKLY